jgi:hypothetical protein
MVRLTQRSSLLAEIHQVVGEQCFAKLMEVFAGITVSFPSKAALEKMRKSREFLNRFGDEKTAFTPGPLGPSCEQALLTAVLEGHHTEAPLYGPEET